ncbi:hypothetical protein [Kribbella sp. NPDC055071]
MARGPLDRPGPGVSTGQDELDDRGFSIVELRHHHASLLISAGLSVVAVAERLGHRDSTETLRTYGHLWPIDHERAVAAVDAALSRFSAPDGTQTERAA